MNLIITITDPRSAKNNAWKTRRVREAIYAFHRAYERANIILSPGYLIYKTASSVADENGVTILMTGQSHGMNDKELHDLLTGISLLMEAWDYGTQFQIIDNFLTQPLDNAEQTGTIRA